MSEEQKREGFTVGEAIELAITAAQEYKEAAGDKKITVGELSDLFTTIQNKVIDGLDVRDVVVINL